MTKTGMIAVAACAVLLIPTALQAQGARRPARERVRTFLVVRIAEALDLSDQEALEVSRILREAETSREGLREQRQEVERKIRAALDHGERDSPDLHKLVEDANTIDRKLALLPEESLLKVQDRLTPEQQARLVLFRPELRGEIRRAMRERLRSGQDRGLR